MVDVVTKASALAAAITFKVQAAVLENLRASLVFADPQYAMQGDFDEGTDTLMWVSIPDIAINTTALTEGTRPDKRALTMNTVTCSTTQYGDLVAITDLAKVKSPKAIVPIATEHLSRQVRETVDQINRDAIAAGGTVKYANAVANRATLAAGDKLDTADLRLLKSQMFAAKIPPFSDGYYRIFVTPGQGYDIRAGSAAGEFIDAVKYSDRLAGRLLSGELGEMAGFRIIEVVNGPTFSSTVTVHAAIAVGDIKGWGAGELQSLQTFHVAPGGDHIDPLGQEELVGWKLNFGVAVLNNSYYFRLESAATAV